MIQFQTSIHIRRPQDEVFGVIADPETYPHWNSAVQAVRPVGDDNGRRRYRMERQLPSGPADNLLEVVSATPPEEVVIRTGDPPTPFIYRYGLRSVNGGTELTVDAEVELEGLARLLGPLAGAAVKRGVDENFSTLKRLLERA